MSNAEEEGLWYVYMIRCRDNSLYTGITTDPVRRLMEHRDDSVKGAKYLRGKSPLELVWKKAVASKSIAAKVEYRLKRLQKSNKEKIVSGENSHEILKEENIAC